MSLNYIYIYIYILYISLYLTENTMASVRNTNRLMSFIKIIALCCKNHTERIRACVGKSSRVFGVNVTQQ